MGVRSRLLIAFFGISGLSVVIAGAALYSFGFVGQVLDRVTQTRVPAVLKTIEISRQAERIVAAAPALLAADTAEERSLVTDRIAAEMQVLNGILVSLGEQDDGFEAAVRLQPVVQELGSNLVELDQTVSFRLQASARGQELLAQLSETDQAVQAVLSPATMVLEAKFARLSRQLEDADVTSEDHDAILSALTELVSSALPLQTAQFEAGRINDMLVFSALSNEIDEIEALAFPLRRSHQNLFGLVEQLQPRFRDRLAPEVEVFSALIAGPDSLPITRVSELERLADGRALLARNTILSEELTTIVNDLVTQAETDITASSTEAREARSIGSAKSHLNVCFLSLAHAGSHSHSMIWSLRNGQTPSRLRRP